MILMLLTAMTFIPLAGAIIILMIPKSQEKFIKNFSIVVSLIPLAISVYLWAMYNNSGDYFAVERFQWIPAIGVQYHMGVDGLSIPLVGSLVTNIVSAFISFVAGAALVVALKEALSITKAK